MNKTDIPTLAITVIIPVFEDSARLEKCLHALHQQTFQQGVQIIVVDNGSSDFADVEKVSSKYPRVTLLEAHEKGSYAARNLALEHLKNVTGYPDIIVFTDSDCVADKAWLEQGVTTLSQGYDLVAGQMSVSFKQQAQPTAVELYELLFAFQQRELVRQGAAITANLFVASYVFEQVGVFNQTTLSGGDVEFTSRATQMGFKLVLADQALVYHPARSSLSEYRIKLARVIGGAYQLRKINSSMAAQFSLWALYTSLIPPIKSFIKAKRLARTHSLSFSQWLKVCGVIVHNKYYGAMIRWSYYGKLKTDFERR